MQGDLFCENFQITKRNNISTALVSIPRFPRFSAHNFVMRRLRMYKYVSTNVGTMYILQKIHFLFSYHQFEWYQEWHNTFIPGTYFYVIWPNKNNPDRIFRSSRMCGHKKFKLSAGINLLTTAGKWRHFLSSPFFMNEVYKMKMVNYIRKSWEPMITMFEWDVCWWPSSNTWKATISVQIRPKICVFKIRTFFSLCVFLFQLYEVLHKNGLFHLNY